MALLILSILVKCLLVLLCMLAHELGHILVARYYRIPIRKIGLNWMGMYVKRARSKGWPEIAVCLAGATMNLVLAVVFWNVNYWFALCSLTFCWVNLLPIPHSDGRHAWEHYQAWKRERLVERVRVAG